jgi:Putative auto-transporter adhesin, head GIN domain
MRVSTAVLSFVLLASAGCFAGVQKADRKENLRNGQTREVPAFHAVSVESGIHATVSVGPQRPLELQGDEKALALIETTVEDGELRIGFKRHSWTHWVSHEVHVSIQTPELRALGASGGSDIRAEMTSAPETEIAASGGGEVHVRGIDTDSLQISGSGGAVIEVAGRAGQAEIEMSGGTEVKGAALSVRNVRIDGSGGSEAELRADGRISGSLSGGSELHIRGNARSRVATSGGSSVDFDD